MNNDGLLLVPNNINNNINTFPNYCQINIDGAQVLADQVLLYGAKLSHNNINKYNVDTLEKIKLKVQLKLPWGRSTITYKTHPIDIYYMRYYPPLPGKRDNGIWLTEIILTSTNGLTHLKRFLRAARRYSQIKKTTKELIVYIMNDGYWPVLNKLPKRDINTIYLESNIMDKLIDDVKQFIRAENDYLKFGIPYKRNYLLEGHAGTGKSSTIFALASHFDMNIAIMNFGTKVDDSVLMYALSRLPDKTILVLEDIDCLFVQRSKDRDSHNHITFSGLLNSLDGIARRHGLLTFMTTNYADKLDPALIRPGRVDYRLKFKNISDKQIKAMFTMLVPSQIPYLDDFFKQIRFFRNALTTAALQQFLFSHRTINNILDYISELETLCNDTNKNNNHNNTLVYI